MCGIEGKSATIRFAPRNDTRTGNWDPGIKKDHSEMALVREMLVRNGHALITRNLDDPHEPDGLLRSLYAIPARCIRDLVPVG